MSVVEHTSVVTMDVQLFAEDGRLVQNVKDHVFIQGIDDVFPAMASHLSGKQVGEDVEGELSAIEAFGEIQPYDVVTYPKAAFGDNFYRLYIGMGLPIRDEQGESLILYVQDLTYDSAVLTINHPLAGQRIGFKAAITALRAATIEELNQGYPTLPEHMTSCSCC